MSESPFTVLNVLSNVEAERLAYLIGLWHDIIDICLCSWWQFDRATRSKSHQTPKCQLIMKVNLKVFVFEYCNLIYLLYVKSVLQINVYFHKPSRWMNENSTDVFTPQDADLEFGS